MSVSLLATSEKGDLRDAEAAIEFAGSTGELSFARTVKAPDMTDSGERGRETKVARIARRRQGRALERSM